ncbi:HAD family hydrolase [Paenibacillus sp. GCM10027626]|uniref:HAD family hydrolase n=1 Tax=Paenibacillus sp. GCM10027626 TaxID=3273411 RepID=UPI0036250894
MLYKAVVFDVDGTLIDTEKAITQSLIKTVRDMRGIEVGYERMAEEFGTPSSHTFAKFGIDDLNMENAMSKMSQYFAEHHEQISIFPEIESVLATLTLGDLHLGIVTSKTRTQFHHEFTPHGLKRYFPVAICADDTKRHKPYSDPLLKYLEIADLDPSEVLYIGDSVYDMECAKGAGVDFGLAVWGAVNKQLPADHVFLRPYDIVKSI